MQIISSDKITNGKKTNFNEKWKRKKSKSENNIA